MLNTTTFVGLDVHARSIKAVALDVMTGETNRLRFALRRGGRRRVGGSSTLPRSASTSPASPGSTCRRSSRRWASTASSARSRRRSPSADRKRKNDRKRRGVPGAHAAGGQRRGGMGARTTSARRRAIPVRALDDAREGSAASSGCRSSSSGMVTCSTRPPRPGAGRATDRGPLGVDKVDIVSREGRRRRRPRTTSTPSGRRAEEKKRLERLVEAEASKPRWKKRVDSLRCLRGVDTMTAADLVFGGRRVSQVQERRVVRRMARTHPLRAFQRGRA